MNNAALNKAMTILPLGYNFEVHKSVWRLQQLQEELGRKVQFILYLYRSK